MISPGQSLNRHPQRKKKAGITSAFFKDILPQFPIQDNLPGGGLVAKLGL